MWAHLSREGGSQGSEGSCHPERSRAMPGEDTILEEMGREHRLGRCVGLITTLLCLWHHEAVLGSSPPHTVMERCSSPPGSSGPGERPCCSTVQSASIPSCRDQSFHVLGHTEHPLPCPRPLTHWDNLGEVNTEPFTLKPWFDSFVSSDVPNALQASSNAFWPHQSSRRA